MARDNSAASKILHSPMLLDWSPEKLSTLDQDQLLNLLANLDHQRAIGRVNDAAAAVLDERITALLSKRNVTKRRTALAAKAAADDTSGS